MVRSASVAVLRSDFDDFLLAPIGEDRHGGLLSVLSALARMEVDPWEEAAKLAKLPEETATQMLASLIAALPDEPAARRDPRTIASRLIALLPRRADSDVGERKTLPGVAAVTRSRVATYVMYYVIFMIVMLVGQWLIARV